MLRFFHLCLVSTRIYDVFQYAWWGKWHLNMYTWKMSPTKGKQSEQKSIKQRKHYYYHLDIVVVVVAVLSLHTLWSSFHTFDCSRFSYFCFFSSIPISNVLVSYSQFFPNRIWRNFHMTDSVVFGFLYFFRAQCAHQSNFHCFHTNDDHIH